MPKWLSECHDLSFRLALQEILTPAYNVALAIDFHLSSARCAVGAFRRIFLVNGLSSVVFAIRPNAVESIAYVL
jgi:hypothetical protein